MHAIYQRDRYDVTKVLSKFDMNLTGIKVRTLKWSNAKIRSRLSRLTDSQILVLRTPGAAIENAYRMIGRCSHNSQAQESYKKNT